MLHMYLRQTVSLVCSALTDWFLWLWQTVCSTVQTGSLSKIDLILLLHLQYNVSLVIIIFLLLVSGISWKQTWSHWTYYNSRYWWTGGKHSLCPTCSEYWNTETATQEIITVILNFMLYHLQLLKNVIWLSLCKWRLSEWLWMDNVAMLLKLCVKLWIYFILQFYLYSVFGGWCSQIDMLTKYQVTLFYGYLRIN
jgi:hypothetical protein